MPTILRMYGECLARIPGDIARSTWVLILPVLYFVASLLIGSLLGNFGIVGGFILGFIECGFLASFLFFLDEVVSRSPVKMAELPQSFRRYFWSVMNVLFVLWIVQILLGLGLANMPNGEVIRGGVMLILSVLLNAAPEVIYVRRTVGGMDIVMGSVNFIQENWIEWFIPNLAFGAAAYFGFPYVLLITSMFGGILGMIATGVTFGALLMPVMIFRGHLFRGLDGTTARSRRYAARR